MKKGGNNEKLWLTKIFHSCIVESHIFLSNLRKCCTPLILGFDYSISYSITYFVKILKGSYKLITKLAICIICERESSWLIMILAKSQMVWKNYLNTIVKLGLFLFQIINYKLQNPFLTASLTPCYIQVASTFW